MFMVHRNFYVYFRQAKLGGEVLSTDDFYTNILGVYEYVFDRLPDAHEWNQRRGID